MTKIYYSLLLSNLNYQFRYILGIFFCISGVAFLYFAVNSLILFIHLLSSFFIGIGTILLFLTFLTYLKHYPTKYLSSYLIGDYGGGIFITILFFLIEYFGYSFKFVI